MSSYPMPILIMTGVNPDDPALTFKAMEAGALEIRPKLPSHLNPLYQRDRTRLIRLIELLSNQPVVRRRNRYFSTPPLRGSGDGALALQEEPSAEDYDVSTSLKTKGPGKTKIIIIGASTGGPVVIQNILSQIKAPAPVPIVIVQHIGKGFGAGLAQWLKETTKHDVVICSSNTVIESGKVFLAPDGINVRFLSPTLIGPSSHPARSHFIPSIDEVFESAAEFFEDKAVGVILSGMGHDGVDGLGKLQRCGSLTIAQTPDTCIASSMPSTAIKQGVANRNLSPEGIMQFLQSLTS